MAINVFNVFNVFRYQVTACRYREYDVMTSCLWYLHAWYNCMLLTIATCRYRLISKGKKISLLWPGASLRWTYLPHFSGCMLSGKLPSTLMHVAIIPLLKCKSKDPADVNNYSPIAIATALSKELEQVLLSRLARYLWTAQPIWFRASTWDRNGHMCTQANSKFLP